MNKSAKIYWVGVIIIGGIMLGAEVSPAQEVNYQQQLKQVAEQLVCLCGCGNQLLYTCTCGEAKENKDFILGQLKGGKSQPEILDVMVKRYGEEVLAAPKLEGINWIIWVVVPYIIPLMVAIGLAFLIMRWVGRRQITLPQAPSAPTEGEVPTPMDKYRRKLEEELKDFE